MVANETLVLEAIAEINLTPFYWTIWIGGGIMILSGIIQVILNACRNKEEYEESIDYIEDDSEETNEEEDFDETESEDQELFKRKESFHKKPKRSNKEKVVEESEMTEEDFNRSEFD